MKVRTSFAPQLQASKMAESSPTLDYLLRTIPCRDETNTVMAEVFETRTGSIVAVFIRYEYDPACRVELIYG